MKTTRSIAVIILGLSVMVILLNCETDKNKQRLSASDTTAILQTVFDFSNADFDTVASISKRKGGGNDTIFIFRNKGLRADYLLFFKGKPIRYTNLDPTLSELDEYRMILELFEFRTQRDTLQVQFGIRDWGLICDYRLVKNSGEWQVIGLGNSRAKW